MSTILVHPGELDAARQKAESMTAASTILAEECGTLRHELRSTQSQLADANKLLAFIDSVAPKADSTCFEPGIGFVEACRREMADTYQMRGCLKDLHHAFQIAQAMLWFEEVCYIGLYEFTYMSRQELARAWRMQS